MINYGTVTSYDRGRRAGMLNPDVSGAPIVFKAADQPAPGPEPELFQHYSYNIHQPDDGGQARAVNLRRHWRAARPQRECEMDLNELLHAHQVEVMKAAASGDASDFRMIAEYADRIRQLRTIRPVTPIAQDLAAPPTIIYGSYAGNSAIEQAPCSAQQAAEGPAREASENPDRGLAHD